MARPQRRFYHALALRLGMTVRQLLHSLDSAELTDWMAYLQLETEGAKPAVDEAAAWRKAFNCG